MTLEEAVEQLEKVREIVRRLSNDEDLDDRFSFYELNDNVDHYIQSLYYAIDERNKE